MLGLGDASSRRARLRNWGSAPVLATLRLLPGVSRPLSGALLAGVLLAAVLPVGFAVASGALVGSVPGTVSGGFDSPPGRRLLVAVAVVGVLFVVQQLAAPALLTVADALGRRLNARLGLRVMAATLSPPGVAHLEDPRVLDRISMAQGVGTGQVTPREAVVGLASVASTRAQGVMSAALLTAFRWWLALFVLALTALTTFLVGRNFKRGVQALRGQPERFRRSNYFRDLALLPAAAKEVRVFGLGSWVGERFLTHWREAMTDLWAHRRESRWLPPVAGVLVLVSQGGALMVLGRAAARGEISVGELTTFAGAVMGVSAMRVFGIENLNIGYGCAAIPSALELEGAPAAPALSLTGTLPAGERPLVGIRFDAVTFRYPGQEADVYRDLTLDVPAGRSLAIVGANGAGKTTLVKLLARLYAPTAGRILVDGVDLAEIDPRSWQRRIAAIFQDFTRYELSMADNVGFGAVERLADGHALAAAARAAGAADIVEHLPAGWETVLSRQFSAGTDLSGGEWQRVALARALFAVSAGAGVLVLDEPTASLDVRAEAAFFDRFLELTRGLTTLVISHRFSTVRRADRIVVIEDGRVEEDGDHVSLLAAGGRYARMFRLQAARFSEGDDADRLGEADDA